MVMQDKRSRIDARWQTLQPGWGKDHSSELRPLYEVLQDDEEIEALVSRTWGPGSVFREDAGRMDRMRRNKGVALVTRERVVMLKGASFGPHLVTEMPLETITSVDYDGAGDGLSIVGLSLSNWLGNDDARGINKITEVRDGQARRFAEKVQDTKANPPPLLGSNFEEPSASTNAAPDFGRKAAVQYAAMGKTERIDAQWRERSTMWGRNEPNPLERIVAVLMSNLSGEKTDVYPGERRMLHEILEDDESIEYWMGGRWGPADEFDTIAQAVTRAAVSTALGAALGHPVGGAQRFAPEVHNGVVVATDRRVVMLNSGMVTQTVVEIPYEGLQVAYNEGLITSGIKFWGSTDEEYAYYFDHNGKAKLRPRTRPLFNVVRTHASSAQDGSGT